MGFGWTLVVALVRKIAKVKVLATRYFGISYLWWLLILKSFVHIYCSFHLTKVQFQCFANVILCLQRCWIILSDFWVHVTLCLPHWTIHGSTYCFPRQAKERPAKEQGEKKQGAWVGGVKCICVSSRVFVAFRCSMAGGQE